ncbi:MAG TPA: tripartite tricarboxylate transporter substrate binding protein [Gammaproteobacteria bacterium]|nr:tripartite tricarboxylate transporter substrate binding protein [Gammaproteobacteria bacterium]
MKRDTKASLAVIIAAVCIAAYAAGTAAQGYPAKPIRVIVPSGAGGSVDTLARLTAQKLTSSLGQQVIVENRSGSGGVIGSEIAARAAPDGYTLLMAYGSHVINPTLYPRLPYDTVKDFVPITQVAVQPLLVNVHPALPVKSVKALIALAKARPGQLLYGSAGAGSGGHLATEIFAMMAGVKMIHVPYKGSAAAMFDVVAGNTQLMILTLITSLPQVRAGKLRAIGISSAKRSPIVPDVPAVAETIPGYDVEVSYFLLAPAGTPRDIIARLHTEAARALHQPDIVERLARDGARPVGNTPEETARYIDAEIVKWGKAVNASGAKAQ